MEIIDIIEEADKEAQKAETNNQKQPNPNLPGEDETLDLSPDLPIMSFMPEQPIMLEQKIDVIMVVVLNDPKIEKTIGVINTAVKNRKVTGVVYGVSDITNVDIFKAALAAQQQTVSQTSQDVPKPDDQPKQDDQNISSQEEETVVD